VPRDSDVYPTARMRSPTRGNSCMASSCPHPLPLPSALCYPQANQLEVRQTMTPSAAQRSQSESHTPTVLGQKRGRYDQSITWLHLWTNTTRQLLLKLTTATTERLLLSAVWREPSGRGAPTTDIRAWPPICHLIFQGNSYSCRQGS
jgi:hypothetical protein